MYSKNCSLSLWEKLECTKIVAKMNRNKGYIEFEKSLKLIIPSPVVSISSTTHEHSSSVVSIPIVVYAARMSAAVSSPRPLDEHEISYKHYYTFFYRPKALKSISYAVFTISYSR